MRTLILLTTFLITLILFSQKAYAEYDFYGLFTAGFAKTELEEIENDRLVYKVGVGYRLHRQWYLEAGIQGFGDNNGGAFPTTDATAGYTGLFLSALGKAEGPVGELYYKLGMAYIDVEVLDQPNGTVCETGLSLVPASPAICEFDDGIIAGQLGFGFDYYFTPRLLLRSEFEWTRGENGFDSTGLYFGIRYNF